MERALRPQEEVRIWIERELEALRPGNAAASSGTLVIVYKGQHSV